MADQSELESKYFLNGYKYNCPFCKIRAVAYSVATRIQFHWTENRVVYIYITKCGNSSCSKRIPVLKT